MTGDGYSRRAKQHQDAAALSDAGGCVCWFALGLPYVLIVRYKTDGDPLLERIFLNLVGLIVVFAGLGLLLVGLDHVLGRCQRTA